MNKGNELVFTQVDMALRDLLSQMYNRNISIVRCHTLVGQNGIVYHICLAHRLLGIVISIHFILIESLGKETKQKIASARFLAYN